MPLPPLPLSELCRCAIVLVWTSRRRPFAKARAAAVRKAAPLLPFTGVYVVPLFSWYNAEFDVADPRLG